MRFRANQIEDGIQTEIIGLLDVAAISGLIYFAVPNGGKRDRRTAEILKATGVKAGVGDICLCHGAFGTFFLEVKRPKGRMSQDQIDFRAGCDATNIPYAVAHSRDEAQDILASWGLLRIATKEAA